MSLGYNTSGGWVPITGLRADHPKPNHIAVFKDQYGDEAYPGPNQGPIYADNEIVVQNADGHPSIEAEGEIDAPSFNFASSLHPDPASITESPGQYSLWLGPGDEPVAANRKLYLGDNPVDTTDGGIIANPPKTDYVMLFKDDEGKECYPGQGSTTEATLDATVIVTGTVETPAVLLDEQSSKPSTSITPLWSKTGTPMYGDDPLVRCTDASTEYIAVYKNADGSQIYKGQGGSSTATLGENLKVQGNGTVNALAFAPTATQPVVSDASKPIWVDQTGILKFDSDPIVTSRNAQTEYLAVFSSAGGNEIYPGQGNGATAILGQNLTVQGQTNTDSVALRTNAGIVGTSTTSNVLFADSASRVNAGAYPVIRSLATPGAPSGGGLAVNKLAIFCSTTGDISPQTVNPDTGEPDPNQPATTEHPVQIENPDPSQPALKVCQNSPEPTTMELCNEGGGGTQIQMGPPAAPAGTPGVPPEGVPVPPVITAVPPAGAPAGTPVTVTVVPAGPVPAALPPPVPPPAIIIPPVGVPPVAIPPVMAPVITGPITTTSVTVTPTSPPPGGNPPGTITTQTGPNGDPVLHSGPDPIVTMPAGTPPGMLFPVLGPTGTIMTNPDPSNPSQITPITPGTPASIPSQTTTIGSTSAGPTTVIYTGPCNKDYKMTWDCSTETMTHAIVDNTASPATTTTVMTTTPASTDVPLLITDGTTLIQRSTNPDSNNTLWYSTSDTARPYWGANKLALYSDTDPGGGGITYDYITLGERSSNPGGSTTLWAQTDHSINYGSNKLALASQLTTDTNPIADNLIVYADTSGNRKTANAAATISQNLIVNSSTVKETGYFRVRPGSDAGGNVVIQSWPGVGGVGFSGIIFNGYYPNAVTNPVGGLAQFNAAKSSWGLNVDQRFTIDQMVLRCGNGGTDSAVYTIDAADKLFRLYFGLRSPRIDMDAVAANPGSTTTIWANSALSNTLQYGAGCVLVDPSPSVNNAIPVYTGTGGQVDTLSTTTAALLQRPLNITASGTSTIAALSSDQTSASFTVGTTNTGTNRGSVTFGRQGFGHLWEFGSDKDISNGDNFYIYSQGKGSQVQTWTPTACNCLVPLTVSGTTNTTGVTIPSQVSNPGSTNTIWSSSADTTRPFFGAGALALLSDVNGTTSTTTVNMGNPTGFTATGNTMTLSRTGKIIQVTGAQLVLTNTSGVSKYFATFAFTWPSGFAPTQSSGCSIPVSLDAGVNYVTASVIITSGGVQFLLPPGTTVANGNQIDTRCGVLFNYVS